MQRERLRIGLFVLVGASVLAGPPAFTEERQDARAVRHGESTPKEAPPTDWPHESETW